MRGLTQSRGSLLGVALAISFALHLSAAIATPKQEAVLQTIPPLAMPSPGSYKLNRIKQVPFSVVRGGDSAIPSLVSRYTQGKITLLAFFYGQCRDPMGCPLAWATFEDVRERLSSQLDLSNKAQLVFFSFDPKRDTPQVLGLFDRAYNSKEQIVKWHFISAWNEFFLQKTLQDFGQAIADGTQDENVLINHLLKVFLIDREGWIREIYTSSFLTPDAVMTDIRTLVLEEGRARLER
jgi:protein SCO1/2